MVVHKIMFVFVYKLLIPDLPMLRDVCGKRDVFDSRHVHCAKRRLVVADSDVFQTYIMVIDTHTPTWQPNIANEDL